MKTAIKDPDLIKAKQEEEKATKDLAAAKRKAAVAYGESARSVLAWPVTGPGGSAAGNKIIKDTLKKMNENEELLDKLKKSIAKEIKESNSSSQTSGALNKAKGDLKEKIEKENEEEKPEEDKPEPA